MDKKILFIMFLSLMLLNGVYASNSTELVNLSIDEGGDVAIDSQYSVSTVNDSVDSELSSDVVLDTSDKLVIYGEKDSFDGYVHYQNETPIKDAEVIFSINSVNYTRLTDVDGIAQLNINLNPGTYSISTTYGDLVNNNTVFVRESNVTLVTEDATNSEIQSIIDNADEGATIEFLGKSYYDISLKITKAVNLVSNVQTTLNGINGEPIVSFTGTKASNSKISGFVLNGGSNAIEILNLANNVYIINNTIVNSNNGIYIDNILYATIMQNNISSIKINAIGLKDSWYVDIINNTINSNFNGIYYDKGNRDINILNNTLEKSGNYAINLDGSGEYSNVRGNSISNNQNGISIQSKADGLNIEYNYIASNKDNGIYFGENYRKTDSGKDAVISDNSILYNGDFNILGRDSNYLSIEIGSNWVGTSDSSQTRICSKIKLDLYELKTTQTDSSSFEITVGPGGNAYSSIPTFSVSVSFDGGKTFELVSVSNGKATIHVSNDDGSVIVRGQDTKYGISLSGYVPYSSGSDPSGPDTPTNPDTPATPDTPTNPDTPATPDTPTDNGGTNGTGTVQGGSGDQGTASGNSNGAGQSSSGSTNVGSSTSSALAGSSSSASSQASESSSTTTTESASESASASAASDSQSAESSSSSVAKSLSIDDEFVRIAGIGAIIVLIILVIGSYYSGDIKGMLNKRKEDI